jgi:sigma-B regulation protein RsbU (phosphoserine phosphatase)
MTALFSVLLVVVIGSAVAVNLAMSRVEHNRALVSERLQPASVDGRSLLVSLVDQETGQRGYVLSGDDRFLRPYVDGGATFRRTLAELRHDFRGDDQVAGRLEQVAAAAARWRTVGAEPEIRARRAGNGARAEALVRTGRGKTAFDEVRQEVASLQALVDARTLRAQQRERSDLVLLHTVVNISRLAIVVILLLGAFLMRRWVLQPVNRLRARMRRVSGGDLDQEVLVDGPEEVAAIARDAENMRRRIVSELEATRGATEALSQHSPVVAALRGELAARAEPVVGGLEIAGAVQSAEGVLAGDWWEALRRPDGSTALVLTDVSGHGAEAGLVAFGFKQRLTALLDTGLDLGAAFTLAARRTDSDDERFLSCLVVVVDPLAHELMWVNAGHPPGLVVDHKRRVGAADLTPTGPLISSVTRGWSVGRRSFGADDLLVVSTDGVIDARDGDGREFGSDGLLGVVTGLRSWSPHDVVTESLAAVRRFAVDVRRDDVTVVALRRVPPPA